MEPQAPEIGEHVIYHDEVGKAFPALLTEVHLYNDDPNPVVNLLYVSDNKAEHDSYGRQIDRPSSISHGSVNKAHGNYWRRPDEEPNKPLPVKSLED